MAAKKKPGIKSGKAAKKAELERTIRLRGYRYGLHDFLAETDLKRLKDLNDMLEAKTYLHKGSLLDRKTKELVIVTACLASGHDWISHARVHMHAAHKAGASPEELLEMIYLLQNWFGGIGLTPALEVWRATFRPDLPTIDRVVELR